MFSFTDIILKENQIYSSLCPELDVASMGVTPEEAKAMLMESATLHIEGAIEDGLPYMRPVPSSEDPRQAASETIVEIFRFTVDIAVHAYA